MARPRRRTGNLPAETTSFIGRRREQAEARKKLAAARVVSLVGPGGVGKTRLSIKVATDLGRSFKDGAWFVELAEIRDPALVGNTVMAALDLRDQAAAEPVGLLRAYLREKELLLVLDNCEHMLGASAQLVGELTRAAPGLRVIATSREPLAVAGEQVVQVPTLELPSADGAETLDQLRQTEAVMLFTERAAAASGAFEVNSANRRAVGNLCRRLDGLPLAIELAAVRTRALSPQQILDRLSDRFAVLTGRSRAALPRHQTLETAIDWSYDLLSEGEQELVRRLCVFAFRFTLEDVEGVCLRGDPPARALDQMSSLVDKSLVIKEDVNGQGWFRLHESMREYALIKLSAAGEREALEDARADYYLSKTRHAAAVVGSGLLRWLEWMDVEIDNVRLVLRRCLTNRELSRGYEFGFSMGWYWITRATAEGARWLDELLAFGPGDGPAYAWASLMRGYLGVLQVDPDSARSALERATAAARESSHPALLSISLSLASIAENMAGNAGAANRMLDEAQAAAAGLDDFAAQVTLREARAMNGFFAGDLDTVRSSSSEAAALSREVGALSTLEYMLTNLAFAALMDGQFVESQPVLVEALDLARQIDDRVGEHHLFGGFGWHAAGTGDMRRAAQLFGAAESLHVATGARTMPFNTRRIAEAEALAVAALGKPVFDREFAAGKRLSRSAAIALALGERVEAAPDGHRVSVSPLGRREAEIAQLVSQGLTNKQIGVRMFISEHTVDSHIRNILNKLGVNSRSQIAAWAASSEDSLGVP